MLVLKRTFCRKLKQDQKHLLIKLDFGLKDIEWHLNESYAFIDMNARVQQDVGGFGELHQFIISNKDGKLSISDWYSKSAGNVSYLDGIVRGDIGKIHDPNIWNGPAFPIGQGRVSSYDQVTKNYQREFDGYYQYGLAYVAQFTPQTIGSPGKIRILEEVLQHITQADNLWIGTCSDLAEAYAQNLD